MFGKGQKPGKSTGSTEDMIHNVHASLNRCLANDQFIGIFYDIFMGSDDEIRQMFARTDFDQQKKLLRKALLSAVTFAAGGAVARERLTHIRVSHNKAHMNVKPEYYPVWLDSLVKTVQACDQQCDAGLEQEWRTVLQPTIDFITSGYLD